MSEKETNQLNVKIDVHRLQKNCALIDATSQITMLDAVKPGKCLKVSHIDQKLELSTRRNANDW